MRARSGGEPRSIGVHHEPRLDTSVRPYQQIRAGFTPAKPGDSQAQSAGPSGRWRRRRTAVGLTSRGEASRRAGRGGGRHGLAHTVLLLEATDRLDSGAELSAGEREALLDRLRGHQETALQRVADLRTQLAQAEEFAATLGKRRTSAQHH